ncbi:MAG: hypothetical protein NZ699_04455 [Roseiflexus sp.]|nr:hypothetical protein [Roseiflexus sp.]MCS7288365.1 hypothetical protein [Roseiflexus sp.]MDW8146515.1 hypothetical protein [Roseiflexaceae bacterium]MDW8231206.1 hypothetical protein [Roseiflexaceae bacterium]
MRCPQMWALVECDSPDEADLVTLAAIEESVALFPHPNYRILAAETAG